MGKMGKWRVFGGCLAGSLKRAYLTLSRLSALTPGLQKFFARQPPTTTTTITTDEYWNSSQPPPPFTRSLLHTLLL